MNKIISYLSTIGVVLGPILVIYGKGPLHLQFFFLIIPFLYLFIRGKFRNRLPKYWFVYLFYYFITSLLFSNSLKGIIPLGVIIFTIFSATCVLTVDYYKIIKVYRYGSVIVITYLFIQIAVFHTIGVKLPSVFPMLPLAYDVDVNEFLIQWQYSDRFSSFFREPAHCAQFLSFFILIELFHDNFKFKWGLIVLSIISLLLLKSGNALIGLGFVFVIYLYSLISSGRKKQYGLASIIIFGIGIAITNWYIDTEEGTELLERRNSISLNSDDSNASGRMRVTRGFALYGEFDMIHKIVGINNQDELRLFTKQSNVNFLFGENDDYYNGITEVLLTTGIIGLFLIVLCFSSLWKSNQIENNCFILLFALYSFVASTFLSSMMLFVFTFCQIYRKKTI